MIHTLHKTAIATIGLLLTLIVLTLAATSASASGACPTPTHLIIGESGQVLHGLPNAVRNAPGTTNSTVIGQIAGGGTFTVLSGPVCENGYNWWQVTNGVITGWTADGDGREAWLRPLSVNTCIIRMQSRLGIGGRARITPGLPNIIRASPGAGNHLGSIPAGGEMDVLGGPACANGDQLWWYVNYNGTQGWTGEMDGLDYWMEPATNAPTCALSPRLYPGISATVTAGEPNTLRAVPDLQGERIGNLPGLTTFTVLQGPVCNDGIHWYQVIADGEIGWTAEGQHGTYWLVQAVCGNNLPSRISTGMVARVTPGLPNRLRSQPNTVTGAILDRIPQGRTVRVLDRWQCDSNGRLWWEVDYNGTRGWTVEGDNGAYWLAPH